MSAYILEMGCGTGRFAEDRCWKRHVPSDAHGISGSISVKPWLEMARERLTRFGGRAVVEEADGVAGSARMDDQECDRVIAAYVLDLLDRRWYCSLRFPCTQSFEAGRIDRCCEPDQRRNHGAAGHERNVEGCPLPLHRAVSAAADRSISRQFFDGGSLAAAIAEGHYPIRHTVRGTCRREIVTRRRAAGNRSSVPCFVSRLGQFTVNIVRANATSERNLA